MQSIEFASSLNEAMIDTAQANGLRWLRFPRAIEAAFEAETGAQRSRGLFWRGLLALLLFNAFLLSDWWVTPDVFGTALIIRLGVATPVYLALTAVLWRNPVAWLRESIELFSSVLAAATTAVLLLLSHAPLHEAQHHLIILVLLFAAMVQRIRFYYLLVGAVLGTLLYAALLLALDDLSFAVRINDAMAFGGATALALLAGYSIEREFRLNFLESLREHLLNERLASLSRQDALTGLANRRSLNEVLGAMETGPSVPLSLGMLLFDIDYFKLYNDTVGHLAGDVCIKRVAGIIRAELRERADMAFRFGGEEFLVLLPDVDLLGAIQIGDRIRHALELARIPHPGEPSGRGIVTVSVGAAAAGFGNGLLATEIIGRADAALYSAKRNGRNQIWPRQRPSSRVSPASAVATPKTPAPSPVL